jgi:hypothetical protein
MASNRSWIVATKPARVIGDEAAVDRRSDEVPLCDGLDVRVVVQQVYRLLECRPKA